MVTSKGFLWGAGAVINREAYFQLRAAGFSRIITYEKYPQIARGEDIELCVAIRLAGYKICYNEELHFQHFISKPKLTWKYLTRLAKEGAAMGLILSQYRRHLNNPSPAAIRTGSWVKLLLRHVYSGISYKRWRWLLSAPGQEGNAEVLKALFEWHSLKAIMSFNKELDRISAGIGQLAANLRSTQSVGQRESSGYRS